MPPAALAGLIKEVPVRLTGVAPIERAISTAGGVAFDALDEHFMLRRRPGVFVAGEMLDWEAPTGGYLLQATFATGAAAGRGALEWLGRPRNA
jgi:predicted flavoprotein YhiN